jgi:hypothetical protein
MAGKYPERSSPSTVYRGDIEIPAHELKRMANRKDEFFGPVFPAVVFLNVIQQPEVVFFPWFTYSIKRIAGAAGGDKHIKVPNIRMLIQISGFKGFDLKIYAVKSAALPVQNGFDRAHSLIGNVVVHGKNGDAKGIFFQTGSCFAG